MRTEHVDIEWKTGCDAFFTVTNASIVVPLGADIASRRKTMNEYIGQILNLVEQGKLSAADAQSLIETIGKAETKTEGRQPAEQATQAPGINEDASQTQTDTREQATKGETKFQFDWNKPITIELPPIAEKLGKEMKDLDPTATLNKAKQEVQHIWEKLWGKDAVKTNPEQSPPNEAPSQPEEKPEDSGAEKSEVTDKWEI